MNLPTYPIQPIQWGYLIFAALMFLMMVALVPRQEIRKLFWFSLLWGPLVDLILVWIIKALKLYKYLFLKPFEFLGAPILNSLAWTPAIVLFIYFLPERKERYVIPFYMGSFSMIGVFVGAFYTEWGIVREIHFHYLMRFPIWYLWFSAAYWHYRKLGEKGRKTSW